MGVTTPLLPTHGSTESFLSCDEEEEEKSRHNVTWDRVIKEEHQYLEWQRRKRGQPSGQRFSVAFSGGGTRAASFQAGVLWRMAEEGLLRQIDYFVAVSGGCYIASAFASDILGAGAPPDDDIDSWYRSLVAKTVVRVQDSIGYLVRDPCRRTRVKMVGCPPVLDIPLLLIVIIFTLSVKPLMIIFIFTIPLAEGVELFFGTSMRDSFCVWNGLSISSFFRRIQHGFFYSEPTRLSLLMYTLATVVFLASIVKCLGVFTIFKVQHRPTSRGRRSANFWHATRSNTLTALTRLGVITSVVIGLVIGATFAQVYEYSATDDAESRAERLCFEWNRTQAGSVLASGAISARLELPWHRVHAIWNQSRHCSERPDAGGLQQDGYFYFRELDRVPHANSDFPDSERVRTLSAITTIVWLMLVAAGFFLAPWFPGLFQCVVFLAGPLALLILQATIIQFRVFGPLTGQCFWVIGKSGCFFPFEIRNWNRTVLASFAACLLTQPIYERLHTSMHNFYMRSLQLAFFDRGKDCRLGDMKENPYCPFFMFTATANDFMRPGDVKRISEIFFSPLHLGGEAIGYIRMPSYRSLIKLVALASAATDALVLGMFDNLRFRFWLETLNLKMGDFLLFDLGRRPILQRLQGAFPRFERQLTYLCVRFPSFLISMTSYLLMLFGYLFTVDTRCDRARAWFGSGVALLTFAYTLSFYGSTFRSLSVSPDLRLVHLATRAVEVSESPPAMIYVSDGGVQDCTGLLQLMRRRCERIVLVIAFDDPLGELNQLRAAMDIVIEQGLGWFYDIDDPRRSYKLTLDEVRADAFKTFFRLGIRYGWEFKPDCEQHAELWVIKNRLPPRYDRTIKPYITAEEVRGESPPPVSRQQWSHLLQTDLGGCCCNCCHLRGCNCGGKFPNHNTGFQCLTPQCFNSLCRLGYNVSGEVMQRFK